MRGRYASFAFAGLFIALVSGCAGGGATLPSAPAAVPQTSAAVSTVRLPTPNAAATPPALSENFSEDPTNGPAAGWTVVSGTWAVCLDGTAHAYCQTSTTAAGEALAGSTAWVNYTVDAVATNTSNAKSSGIALLGRVAGPQSFYSFELRPQSGSSTPYWYLWRNAAGKWSELAGGPLNAPDANVNYHLRLTFSGSSISAALAFDGGTSFETLATVSDATISAGQVGVHTWQSGTENVQNITVTLTPAPPVLPAQNAISTHTFVNSLGLNAHFESSTYSNNPSQIAALVGNLGIHHYRVSAANILFPNGAYLATLTSLYRSAALTYDVLADLHTTPAQIVQAVGMLPAGSVDAVEGPNEADNPGQGIYYDPNFAVDVPAYQKALYAAIKSTPATASLTVIGPSFVNSTSYAAVGNISNDADAGNMHDYFAGFNPGTAGWGGSGYAFAPSLSYGSIPWNIASAAQATGTKPVDATETGYYTAAIHGGVPFDVQAKYVPRLFFEQLRNQVPRSYMYQLAGYDTTSEDGSLDIVSPALVPSPAYTALQQLIGLLDDGTSNSSASTVNWQLSGNTANVHYLTMHKTDGTVVLPLWIETESFDPNANGGAGAEIAVTPQAVTATFGGTAHTGTLWTCNAANGSWTSMPVALTNGAYTFNVTDSVSVLEIAPS